MSTRPSATARAQAKKGQLIAGLIETRSKILNAALTLAPAEQDRVFLGVWSARDMLAHLAGWDVTNLAAAKALLAGRLPAFYAYRDPDWKTYNARLVLKYRRDRFADLVALTRETHQALMEFLAALPADDFDRDRGVRFRGYKVTIARLLEAELKDEKIHQAQLHELSTGNE